MKCKIVCFLLVASSMLSLQGIIVHNHTKQVLVIAIEHILADFDSGMNSHTYEIEDLNPNFYKKFDGPLDKLFVQYGNQVFPLDTYPFNREVAFYDAGDGKILLADGA